MELTKLNNFFKESTEVTLATVTPEGELNEETVKVYHWDVLTHRTAEMKEQETSLVHLLFDAEKDTENPIPVVTRQLHLLGIYSKDLTDGGKPVTDDLDVLAKIPLGVQSKIAREICAPAMGVLQIMTLQRKADDGGAGEDNDESLSGNSQEDGGGAEEAQSSDS